MTDTLMRLVDNHSSAQYSLLLRLFMMLLGLWTRPGVVTNPHRANALVGRTILLLWEANIAARMLEREFVRDYAHVMGVSYADSELNIEAFWPRDVQPVEEITRVLEEYRYRAHSGNGVTLHVPDVDENDFEDAIAAANFPDDANEDALAAAVRRLYNIVDTDLQRARDDEHTRLLEKKRVWLGYRRVIHPERSRTGTCGLCVVAATRRYNVKELKPIHRLCKCTQIGITADVDAAADMNRGDIFELFQSIPEHATDERIKAGRVEFTRHMLEQVYEAAGSNQGVDLKDVRVHVIEHGELGPLLSWYQESGRDRNRQKKWRRPNLADTQAGWAAMREWAERRRDQALQAIDFLGDEDGLYREAVEDFEAVINRMRQLMARTL